MPSIMRIWPKNEQRRKQLRHPSAGVFRPEGHASWPRDAFTLRLLRDGDVLDHDPATPAQPVKSSRSNPNTE